MNDLICPLCEEGAATAFHQDKHRDYYLCSNCRLVFVPPGQWLTAVAEKAEYDLHENSPHDAGYRRFLGRLFNPLVDYLEAGSAGLDFGCGPGPTLSLMFKEAGFPMEIYDPFYADQPHLLEQQYDFITATEVVEHLHDPKRELERLWCCLKPKGKLGIMTKLVIDREAFAHWHYKNDLTHVCFFSLSTFEWLAAQWQAELTFFDKDVVLLSRI